MTERKIDPQVTKTSHVGVGTTSIIVADIMRRVQPEQDEVQRVEISTNGHKKGGIPPLENVRPIFKPQTA